MLVRIAFGSRFGEVVDLLPTAARAMLNDGRASLPETVTAPDRAVITERVESRQDRVEPRAKRRRHR